MTEILPVFLALIGVIALMLAAIYLLKWLNSRISGGKNTKGIRVITCVGVGQDKSIMAVRAGNKNLLLGVTSGGISLICELDETDMAVIEDSGALPADMAGKSFAECLRYNMKKMGGEFIRPYKNVGSQTDADDSFERGVSDDK